MHSFQIEGESTPKARNVPGGNVAGNVEWGMWRGSADGKRREEVDLKENFKNLFE